MDPTAITMGLKWPRTLSLSRYIEAIYSRTNWPLSVSVRTQGHMGGQSADKVPGGWAGGGRYYGIWKNNRLRSRLGIIGLST